MTNERLSCKITIVLAGQAHFARVAQWWSIALPRRGSRVRIPSRAFSYAKKQVAEGSPVFSCIRILFKEEKRSCGFLSGRLQYVEENSEELQHATRDDKNVEDAVDVMLLRAD